MGFGILGLLVIRSIIRIRPKRYFLISGIISVIYAASDELHQFFVPGRQATIGDWAADTLGILFFMIVYHLIRINSYKTTAIASND